MGNLNSRLERLEAKMPKASNHTLAPLSTSKSISPPSNVTSLKRRAS